MASDVLDLSADEDSSPVSELSFSLQNLHCQDGTIQENSTPRRKLVVTPEWDPQQNTLSRERETPTVSALRRRRSSRSLTPESSSDKKVRSRCLLRDHHDSVASKEKKQSIKRVRVRLFSSGGERPAGRNWRQNHSNPEENDTYPREIESLHLMTAVRFCRLRSHRKTPPTHITEAAVSDLSLIGDFSKQHLLPVEHDGRQELHCVTSHTVASLIRGQFGSAVEDFLIIDCRYPYEYQGGHIKGAVNLYTESQIHQAVLHATAGAELSPCPTENTSSWGRQGPCASESLPEKREAIEDGASTRKLIVFHCEFSSERGPHLCQYLRRLDRCLNAHVYPNLHYPEIYLLLGGYKHFHACYPDLCDPCGYIPMRHCDYLEQLQEFCRRRSTRQRRRRPIRKHHRVTRKLPSI